ncbi:unnamed protein product, partial [Rotaria sp. Silwood2]
KIFDVVSTPDLATLDEVCEPYAKYYIHKLPPRQKQNYKKLVGYKYETGSRTLVYGVSLQGIALLDQLLSFDHRTRLTAEEALAVLWKMIEDFQPLPWASEDIDDDI